PIDTPSEPMKTPLGWHILRVVKIEAPATQSFEEAKSKIEAELKLQDAIDRIAKVGNQADDSLAAGAPLDEVAPKYGRNVPKGAAGEENGEDPDSKPVKLPMASEDVLKTAFATSSGEASRITDTQDGSIFAVKVDKVTEPQVRPLADVKDKAVAAWQAE